MVILDFLVGIAIAPNNMLRVKMGLAIRKQATKLKLNTQRNVFDEINTGTKSINNQKLDRKPCNEKEL